MSFTLEHNCHWTLENGTQLTDGFNATINGTMYLVSEGVIKINGKVAKTCITRGDAVGLTFIVEAGFMSLAAILICFYIIGRNWYRLAGTDRRLFSQPPDVYMFFLLISDVFQALGAILDIRWINRGFVQYGDYCTAQGALQQFGESSVAMLTLLLALHTFAAIWFRCAFYSLKIAFGLVTCVYLYTGLYTILGIHLNGGRDYIAPSPAWCWISGHLGDRIAGEYAWFWLTLFTSLLVYVPLYLLDRGNVSLGERWWQVRFHRRGMGSTTDLQNADQKANKSSFALLAYPISYSILVLPLSVVRWITFQNPTLPVTVPTFIVGFIFGLSGATNVTVLMLARPLLLLLHVPEQVGLEAGISPTSEVDSIDDRDHFIDLSRRSGSRRSGASKEMSNSIY